MDFKLEIKNLALSDSKGHDLQKDIVVKVTSLASKQVCPSVVFSFVISEFSVPAFASSQVWIWSKTKFVNRKFLMEDVYQRYQSEQREGRVRGF